ncbi:MAG: Tetracycline resistance protein, class C [Calditrichaeota bacterium]|nr:Tetracycline resistance protein, class C [Calditrichota bacterium]
MQRSPLAIILSTVFIALIGFGIVIPLMPVYGERFGASGFEVGALVMTYSLMQFLLAPIAGRISDRIGRRPVLISALFLTSGSYVLFGLADSLPMLFASRLLAGVGGADITVAQAYIADVTPPHKRARGMGLFGAAFGVGFVIGPSLTALTFELHEGLPSFIAAGLAGATAIWALFMLPEPERHAERRSRTLKPGAWLTKVVGVLMSFQFVTVFTQALLQSMLVLFTVERLGWNEKNNGLFLSMIGGISALIQGGLIGRLAAKFGERNLARVGLLLMGLGMFAFSRVGPLAYLYAGGVINAIGFALTLPSLSSLASREAPPGRQGRVLGSFQSMGSLARIFGPLAGGLLYDLLNPNAPFAIGAVIATAASVMAIAFLRGPGGEESP